MRRAIRHHPATKPPAGEAAASITLAFEDRHKRRIQLKDDSGEAFLLDLPHAVAMGHGDLLELADGGLIRVLAAAEPVLEVRGKDACHTTRLAWHVGNRHTPLQVLDDGRLRLRQDPVLQEMLRGLGAGIEVTEAPFAPEAGAYATGHGHAH